MSDGIEVRSGGAIAVDTETLRHAAARFLDAHTELSAIAHRASTLMNHLFDAGRHTGQAYGAASELVQSALHTAADAERICDELRAAAAVYELVELDAQHQAAQAAGDTDALVRIDAMRARITAEYPDARNAASLDEFDRTVLWPSELVKQAAWLGIDVGRDFGFPGAVIGGSLLGFGTLGVSILTGATGWGRIARDARLTGGPAAVSITPVTPQVTATSAPTSLAAAAARVPSGGASRVRVERYTMPDGSRQFAVYVAGTESWVPGGKEAWDSASAGELFVGRESASYTATAEALEAAGAEPGDVVHAVGFSQGAMITSHLALEGDYDVRTLVSLGSPVEADVGGGTLSVSIRHTDDPVVALSGGGYGTQVGARGSFIVEAVADAGLGSGDATAPAHRLEVYTTTSRLVDESGDPRVRAVTSVFEELGTAASVDAFEYGAERTEASKE